MRGGEGRRRPADGTVRPERGGLRRRDSTNLVYITSYECESNDPGSPCDPWTPPYLPDTDLRYAVRLEYEFQPVLPFVGFLTGNGFGGSVPISIENRSPVLIGYEGTR